MDSLPGVAAPVFVGPWVHGFLGVVRQALNRRERDRNEPQFKKYTLASQPPQRNAKKTCSRSIRHNLNAGLTLSCTDIPGRQFLPFARQFDLKMSGLIEDHEAAKISNFLRHQPSEFFLIHRPDLCARQPRGPVEIARDLHRDARPVSRW